VKKTALALAFALAVSGCAREPTLRSVVYRGLGADMVIIEPISSAPGADSKAYASNKYPYVPGTFVLKIVEKSRDPLLSRAEVWNTIAQGKNYCQQRILKLHEISEQAQDDVVDDYIVDQAFSLDPRTWFSGRAIRQTYSELRDDEFGRLKRVTIKLTNIKSYSLTSDQTRAALEDIEKRKCIIRIRSQGSPIRVRRLIVADLDVDVQYAGGVKFKSDVLVFNIFRFNGFARNAKKVLIAVSAE
jgi:hypothetical protein